MEHKQSARLKQKLDPVSEILIKDVPSNNDFELAAKEGTFSYHAICHNHSFRSMDCISALVKELFDRQFSNSRKKCEAIVISVLAPQIINEIVTINSLIQSNNKLNLWSESPTNKTPDKRWVDIFHHFNQENHFPQTRTIVEFVFSLPGTSAPVERVFSIINKYWTIEKTQLLLPALEAVLYLKLNYDKTCKEYYTWLKTQPAMLKSIHSSKKYSQM